MTRLAQRWSAIGPKSRCKNVTSACPSPTLHFTLFGTGAKHLRADPTLTGRHEPTTERPVVPRPTPVSFPTAEMIGVGKPVAWTQDTAPDLYSRFAKIRKPPDVTVDHLQALNLRFFPSCDFEDLLGAKNASQFLPPICWLEPPSEGEGSNGSAEPKPQLLANGRQAPTRLEFYTRVKELFHTNEEAFYTLVQRPHRENHGPKPIRLVHFRRFWEGLENMAYFWDTSLDEYSAPKVEDHQVEEGASTESQELPVISSRESRTLSPDPEEPRKRPKQDHGHPHASTEPHHGSQHQTSHTVVSGLGLHPLMHPSHHQHGPTDHGTLDEPTTHHSSDKHGSYKGRRIGDGAGMPEQHRVDTIRSFVEPIAWCFGFTINVPRRPTLAHIKNLRVPIRLTTAIWQVPSEREKAKQGWLVGPVAGISCRNETGFAEDKQSEIIDLLKEVGIMLVLAQQRAREGKTEAMPGEGKWWTTKPRWGGGPGGEVGEGSGNSDEPVARDEQQGPEGHGHERRLRGRMAAPRRRMSAVEVWKMMLPSMGYWDRRVNYSMIGKDKESDWDEVSHSVNGMSAFTDREQVFLISSLYHHISVLKLRVHQSYLDYLTDGVLPACAPTDDSWPSPTVQRTRWFNLFVAEDRAEAARGIWGVMACLARPRDA